MARAGASDWPTGAGTFFTTSSSSAPTPRPVFAETRSTSSGSQPDDVRDLLGVLVRVGGREVDLVQHRDDGEVVLHRQVQVRQRLRLDALRGVDQQHGALTGLQCARHLVGEVDVARRVDHVQHVVRALDHPRKAHVLRLDGDPALPLDVHPVEVLGPHRPRVDHAGELQHPIGQGGLAVVDVRDDAEVPDQLRRRERLVGERAQGDPQQEIGRVSPYGPIEVRVRCTTRVHPCR